MSIHNLIDIAICLDPCLLKPHSKASVYNPSDENLFVPFQEQKIYPSCHDLS